MSYKQYPLIDIFAGPGGLGEGFSSLETEKKKTVFDIAVSIERDEHAFQTLFLRHFFKSFGVGKAPIMYYDYLNGDVSKSKLFENFPKNFKEAKDRVFKISLGQESHDKVRKIINNSLNGEKAWALIGGPPCQAYSLVGRSRMKSNPDFKNDERNFLYKEYLKIIYDHKPPVFIMENVKGLLSAKVNGAPVISRIISDLSSPQSAISETIGKLKYNLYSLSDGGGALADIDPKEFIVKSEQYGVPQARHRIFIVGVRSDIKCVPKKLKPSNAPSVKDVLGDLPKIRSSISRRVDNADEWRDAVENIKSTRWYRSLSRGKDSQAFSARADKVLNQVKNSKFRTSNRKYKKPKAMSNWFYDEKLKGVTCHETRGHMESDLHRYLFSSLYAQEYNVSPKMKDFPEELLPDHKNVGKAVSGKMFSDRFRVQIANKVSTTITSHISKDGHYFIHYDPAQCRSLTVREAARLQTFPDNYHFEGPRTAKLHQVGNAVPPFLAFQISVLIKEILDNVES